MDVQRWTPDAEGVMQKNVEGNWVKFRDYETDLSILKANVRTLKTILMSMRKREARCTVATCSSADTCCMKNGDMPLYVNCTGYAT